jgi:hypothetical protein
VALDQLGAATMLHRLEMAAEFLGERAMMRLIDLELFAGRVEVGLEQFHEGWQL